MSCPGVFSGEAATHVPEEVVLAHPEIPWRDMRDMRNFVVHEYFGISDKIIWGRRSQVQSSPFRVNFLSPVESL